MWTISNGMWQDINAYEYIKMYKYIYISVPRGVHTVSRAKVRLFTKYRVEF